ncbi:MAG: NAD(P)H-hydrate dehydratase [Phycisphaerales bacterium JB043]
MATQIHELRSLPARTPRGHKGTFGTVGVVGGRCDARGVMIGGPCFTSIAALRSGCGLCRLALPETIMSVGLTIAPGATGVPMGVDESGVVLPGEAARVINDLAHECDTLAVGPGLGMGDGAEAIVASSIRQDACPVVLDADGINCLAHLMHEYSSRPAHAILTPHAGEFARLAQSCQLDLDPVTPIHRARSAVELARHLGCVVVLKGAHTIVADADDRYWESSSESPWLATAGTGDVLTGVIASILAQHHDSKLTLFDCACLGVRAHTLASDQWHEDTGATGGMLAGDLLDRLAGAVEVLRRDR